MGQNNSRGATGEATAVCGVSGNASVVENAAWCEQCERSEFSPYGSFGANYRHSIIINHQKNPDLRSLARYDGTVLFTMCREFRRRPDVSGGDEVEGFETRFDDFKKSGSTA
jgi:hypothetical protein